MWNMTYAFHRPNYTLFSSINSTEMKIIWLVILFVFGKGSYICISTSIFFQTPVIIPRGRVVGGFMRGSRHFCHGGTRPNCQKNSSDNVYYYYYYYYYFKSSTYLQFHSGLSMVYFKVNYNFRRFQRGSNKFQGSYPTFLRGGGWGSKCSFLFKRIELVIFQGGSDPLSPLWFPTWVFFHGKSTALFENLKVLSDR